MFVIAAMPIALAVEAWGDSFNRFVSTPVSPPRGFEWIRLGSLLALVLANIALFRGRNGKDWLATVVGVPVAVMVFAYLFYRHGCAATLRSTAPPPGLGRPSGVFWGWGWGKDGGVFLSWNLRGLVFLLVCVAPLAYYHRMVTRKQILLIVSGNAVAYALCLSPYVGSGALVHGWHGGGYVFKDCEPRTWAIAGAAGQYAREHHGRLPRGSSLGQVLPQMRSPREWYRGLYHDRPDVCPVSWARDVDPLPYVWNVRFSGKTIAQAIRLLNDGELLIICPRHRDRRSVDRLRDTQVLAMQEYSER